MKKRKGEKKGRAFPSGIIERMFFVINIKGGIKNWMIK